MKKLLEKYKELKLPVKASIWFTLCNLMLKGVSLITVPLFARLLAPDEYGLLSIYLSYQQVILIFATWELPLGAYQKGIFRYKKDIPFFTASIQLLANLITSALFVILVVFREYFKAITGMTDIILVCLFIYLLLQPAYNNWLELKRSQFEYKAAVTVTILYTLLSAIIPLIAVRFWKATAEVQYVFTLLSAIAVFCPFYISSCKYIWVINQASKLKEQWKYAVHFQLPLVLHSLSYLILGQADRIMIGSMVGNAQAAYYSVAYNLATMVSIFQNSINQVMIPWRYKKMEEKAYDEIRKNANYLLLGLAGLIILFVLIAPEAIKILFTKDYYEAIWSIPPVAVSMYFVFLYSIFVNIETYFEQTKYVMYVSITCALTNIVLNYFGIILFGYVACGYTTLICYILFAIGHYYFMNKISKKNIPGVKLFDVKAIIAISAGLLGAGIVTTLLYEMMVVRYALMILILLLAALNYRKIKKLINMFR